jgi:hypothetical protein
MQIWRPPLAGFQQVLAPISGRSSDESGSGVNADDDELNAQAKGWRIDVMTGIPRTILVVRM